MISPARSSARSCWRSIPPPGKKLDYLRVARELEAIRTRVERESGGGVRVHIIGFAKVMGAVGDGARGVLLLFGVSIIVTALLVWYYAGRWKISGAPVLCSFIAVIWQLGLLTALGYRHRSALDPGAVPRLRHRRQPRRADDARLPHRGVLRLRQQPGRGQERLPPSCWCRAAWR